MFKQFLHDMRLTGPWHQNCAWIIQDYVGTTIWNLYSL